VIQLEIPGRPVPWQRVQTNQGRFFTPQKTRDYEEIVAYIARAKREKIGDVPCDVSIELYEDKAIVTLTPRPDAKKRKLKGDVDNYAKAILDGLQKGQMLEDDRQVNELHLTFHCPAD
jgi:Holliday junction resolvase RusA-like endonuclease